MGDKEIRGYFKYEQDSKRYHRFQIETKEGITGSIYMPKDLQPLADRIVLEKKVDN